MGSARASRRIRSVWVVLAVAGALTAPLMGPGFRLARTAQAANIYCVGPGSGASGCKNTVDYSDIQQAIDAAVDGDQIHVAKGTYAAVTIPKSVTITGGYPGGPDGYCCGHDSTGTVVTGIAPTPGITVTLGGQPTIDSIDFQAVQVDAGVLHVSGNGTTTAAFEAAAGGAVEFVNGSRTLADGTMFSGAGPGRVGSGATVTISGLVTAQTFEVAAGVLNGPGVLHSTGTLTWTGGSINGGGTAGTGSITIDAGATMNISGPNAKYQRQRLIENSGTVHALAGFGFGMSGDAVINNLAGGTFDVQADVGLGFFINESGGRTFNNSGTLRKSAGTGTTGVNMTFTTSGTVDVESGNLQFTEASTSTGAYTIAAGATVTFQNATHTLNGGTTISGPGTATVLNASIVINGAVSADNFALPSGTLTGPGALTIGQSFTWTGGAFGGTGSLSIPAGATMTISGSAFRVLRQRRIDNAGTIALLGGSGFGMSGDAVINNLAGGLFDVRADVGAGSFVSESGGRTLNNMGTLRKSAGTGSASMDMALNNTGVVEVQSGDLKLTNGATTSSAVDIASGASVTVSNSALALNAGAAVAGAGLLTVANGTVTINDAVTMSNFLLPNGTLNGPGALSVGSTFAWTGGNISGGGAAGAGSIVVLAGSTMTISGPAFRVLRQRLIDNAGTVTLTAGFGASQGAAVNNRTGGTLDIQADIGVGSFVSESGSRTFTNAGTVRKSAGSGTATMDMTFSTTGAVNAQSGTLRFTAGFTQTTGATTLNGGNLAGSTLDIEGGVLSGAGNIAANVTNAGQLSPGASPGVLSITGNYSQTAAGALNIEIAGTAPGTGYDQLAVSGVASLAGALNLSLTGGFTPGGGDTFQVMTFGSRGGTFATVTGTDLPSGQSLAVSYNAANVTVTASAPPNPVPTITSLSPALAAGSDGLTLTIDGGGFVTGSTVQWNGVHRPTTYVGATRLTAAIPASDVASTADITVATVTVVNPAPGGGPSNPAPFTVVGSDVTTAGSATALPGGAATVSTAPAAAGQAGVAATLTNAAGGPPATVTAATYASNPAMGGVFDAGGGFTDLRVAGAGPGDSVAAKFYYSSSVTGATESALQLLYFDGSTWTPVHSSGNTDPAKSTTDNLDATISGGRFAVTFDATSTPPISGLTGTVFTASVTDHTPPVITPQVTGTLGANGWYTSNVAVTWTVTDPESAITVRTGCDADQVTADTAGVTFTCTATSAGGTASQSVMVKRDATAPSITCSVSPNRLWPPNHKLVNVTATVSVTDALSGANGFTLIGVSSSEPDSGQGDGDVPDDIVGFVTAAASTNGQLRAERSGNGNGRTYTLTYQGTDKAGNTATCTVMVAVPHDQGH